VTSQHPELTVRKRLVMKQSGSVLCSIEDGRDEFVVGVEAPPESVECGKTATSESITFASSGKLRSRVVEPLLRSAAV
jgi:hypothetical protein